VYSEELKNTKELKNIKKLKNTRGLKNKTLNYKSESNDIKIREDLQNFFSSRFLISVFVLFSIKL